MKKNLFLSLLGCCLFWCIPAKAQSSGVYVYGEGMTHFTGQYANKDISQDQMTLMGALGIGYIYSPGNDGQGVSLDLGLILGFDKTSYTNMPSKANTRNKLKGGQLSIGYHKLIVPYLYYVPNITLAYTVVEPSTYVQGYGKWYDNGESRSFGVGISLLNFEHKLKNSKFGVRFSMGSLSFVRTPPKGDDDAVRTFDFDMNNYSMSIIYYL